MSMGISTCMQTFELVLAGCLLTLAGFGDGCMQLFYGWQLQLAMSTFPCACLWFGCDFFPWGSCLCRWWLWLAGVGCLLTLAVFGDDCMQLAVSIFPCASLWFAWEFLSWGVICVCGDCGWLVVVSWTKSWDKWPWGAGWFWWCIQAVTTGWSPEWCVVCVGCGLEASDWLAWDENPFTKSGDESLELAVERMTMAVGVSCWRDDDGGVFTEFGGCWGWAGDWLLYFERVCRWDVLKKGCSFLEMMGGAGGAGCHYRQPVRWEPACFEHYFLPLLLVNGGVILLPHGSNHSHWCQFLFVYLRH